MEELELKFNWRRFLRDKVYQQNLIDFLCELGDTGYLEGCKMKYDLSESKMIKEIFDKYFLDKEDHGSILK